MYRFCSITNMWDDAWQCIWRKWRTLLDVFTVISDTLNRCNWFTYRASQKYVYTRSEGIVFQKNYYKYQQIVTWQSLWKETVIAWPITLFCDHHIISHETHPRKNESKRVHLISKHESSSPSTLWWQEHYILCRLTAGCDESS